MPIMIFMTRYSNSLRNICRGLSVSQYISGILNLLLSALVIFFISSCKKETLKLGSDILPGTDFVSINSIDTLSAFSYTMFNDSIRTDHPTKSYLGQDFDPYFGSTTSGFVSQIRLIPKWDGLPYTVDSVKLYLRFLNQKGGGTDALHTLSLYEISDEIFTDSAYYTRTPLNLTGFKVANILLPKLSPDSINQDVGLLLPNKGVEFGNYLIRDTTKLFYNNNIPDFRSYFKGFYFQLDPSSEPLLLSLSLVYDLTTYYNYFVLYGHDNDGVEKDYSFILDAKNANAAYNRYSHDYTTATQGDKMAHVNTTYRDTLSYLQSLNGVYTKISMPGLEKLKSAGTLGKIAVNRARLVVPFKFTSTTTTYYAKSLPLSLRLRYKVKNGSRYDVPDYSMGAATTDLTHHFFDGTLDSVKNVYNFNIPAFVQSYLEDATNSVPPEVEIYEASGLNNIILRTSKSKTPLKFEFAYTKF
jgi:hypothetical protein